MATINKQTLEYLANLARIEISPKEEEKLLKDLQSILDYFEELKTLDTTGIAPVQASIYQKNVLRDDEERISTNRGAGTEAFPEQKDGFLEVPAVFD